ncbi:hypothetical protein RRG08_048278 [Elysia crispata]|uniref:Uncharacterized protein n=1 Tax=Elysia crispata TaxID=231223 RepID=A0AAE0ZTI8_9GAST|nr:hypothetical protein RRG08_048278 [Elysia crispata]
MMFILPGTANHSAEVGPIGMHRAREAGRGERAGINGMGERELGAVLQQEIGGVIELKNSKDTHGTMAGVSVLSHICFERRRKRPKLILY